MLYQLSYFRKCEEEETRTPTSQLTLPPQSSASTNSATSPLHIRLTLFSSARGCFAAVFRCGIGLASRLRLQKYDIFRNWPSLHERKMHFLLFSSLFACKKGDICAETRGFSAESGEIFPTGSRRSSLSCVRRVQSTRRCSVFPLDVQSACPMRPTPALRNSCRLGATTKKGHLSLSLAEKWEMAFGGWHRRPPGFRSIP